MSDSEEEISEKQFKIVLLGDSGVGKTSIAARYANGSFTKQFTPTPGVDFYLKRTTLPGQRNVAIKVWDVGGGGNGNGSVSRMLDKYVFGANAIVLVYDVTSQSAFENLEDWLSACKKHLAPSTSGGVQAKGPAFALVANKIDLEHRRTIKSDRHHRFAQENGLLTYAVSAKSGEGVDLCFQKIAAELLGIRLSKADQEQHQTVVRADIVTYRQERLNQGQSTASVKTAVCAIQ